MSIKLADKAGFCFGVKRAMNMAWEKLETKGDAEIYALGQLIHNRQAVSKYEEKGLKTVNNIDEIKSGTKMIIRSHGVSKVIYDTAEEKNIEVIDATCPFVKKIHEIVKEYYLNGYKIIIVGDKNHAEVKGIAGWCNNDAIYIKDYKTLSAIKFDENSKYCLVSQTTMNEIVFDSIINKIKSLNLKVEIKNTICSATSVRQKAARSLAKEVDLMIVIGGRHSSNTQKLVAICQEEIKTVAIETGNELKEEVILNSEKIGITAGASTPDWIIKEVIILIENLKNKL